MTAELLPASEAEAAEALREATRAGHSLVVRGGGTKPGWAATPATADVVLGTGRLDRLVEHQPGDLICVAGAGMRLADLQATVADAGGHRQRLMLDPPHGDAQTLGGIVAANASGPLRTRYGSPRDLVIGARFALADGTIAKTGGKVVKNVAGYDLSKLLVGSLGTLAVVTELAFRLHPLPAAARTLALDDAGPDAIAAFAAALASAPVTPSACEAVWPDGSLLVRVESTEEGAERQCVLAATLAPGARLLEPDEAEARWAAHATRPWQDAGTVVAVGAPPSRLAALLRLADAHGAELVVRAPVGVGEARLPDDPAAVAAFRAGVEALGGHVGLRRSSPAVAAVGSTSADPVAADLARAVKSALDPAGTLPAAPGT